MGQSAADLKKKLLALDGRGYKAYKEIKGESVFSDYRLLIDHVQGDPFATASRFRLKISQKIAKFPENLTKNKIRQIALADFLNRKFSLQAKKYSTNRGIGKSGLIEIDTPSQAVLERSAATVNDAELEIRFFLGLPARGRSILAKQAVTMIFDCVPDIVEKTLKYQNLDAAEIQTFVETVEDAEAIRGQLKTRGLVAFVADGAILPRKSGIDDRPLKNNAVPFKSPAVFKTTLNRPNAGKISGMGIPVGVTLIVGGGYHGKSTLLKALAFGIYNHPPGDGREYVVTDPDAVKIRAEDGRSISGVNLSPFINNLPQGKSTTDFSTGNASGSTSQAANIIEALELKASVLLIDEDTAATNFMIRDQKMQELIAKTKEPITPFIDKVRQLYTDCGVSTILVIGGSGDYFSTADQVIAMENYQPCDVTEAARKIAEKYATERTEEGCGSFGEITARRPQPVSLNPSTATREVFIKTYDSQSISFGKEKIDLSALEQVVEKSQVRAIAHALLWAKREMMDGKKTFLEIATHLMTTLQKGGLDQLTGIPSGDLAKFRRFEWAAALNRLRTLKVRMATKNKERDSG